MTDSPKLQHLTVFLLKPDRGLPVSALREPKRLKRFGLRRTVPFKGSLWLRAKDKKEPGWVPFVRPALKDDIVVATASASAVLVLQAADRYFAVTFGYGRFILQPGSFERDFGLRVTLNAVRAESIRSIDARTFETPLTIQTRRQASRGSSLDVFGLNVSHDLVRAVAGDPQDAAFARRLAGADAVAISAAVDVEQLADKCAELLRIYARDTYREHFGFIDHIRKIKDPDLLDRLEARLSTQLEARECDRIHLAAPEIDDPERVEGFSYSNAPDTTYPGLDIDQCLRTLGERREPSARVLKRLRVRVQYAEAGDVERWRLYDCVAAEVDLEERLFVLSSGDWFEIEPDFAARIRADVARVAETPVSLPAARRDETEGRYNSRVARKLKHALLDRQLVRRGGVETPIEACDLFTPKRQFIHVKRKTHSSTLSHLFAQGLVAADAFLHDAVFRQDIRGKLEDTAPEMVALIPEGRPPPEQFEIAYAVVSGHGDGWPNSLPFFSQVNLRNAADRLERLGFRVSISRIDER